MTDEPQQDLATTPDVMQRAEAVWELVLKGWWDKEERALAETLDETEATAVVACYRRVDQSLEDLAAQHEVLKKHMEGIRERLDKRFEQALREFNETHRKKRSKSVDLATGRISLRAQPDCLKIIDREACLAWCYGHLPDAVKTYEDVQKKPLVEHLEKTGELADGCEFITSRPDSLSIGRAGGKK